MLLRCKECYYGIISNMPKLPFKQRKRRKSSVFGISFGQLSLSMHFLSLPLWTKTQYHHSKVLYRQLANPNSKENIWSPSLQDINCTVQCRTTARLFTCIYCTCRHHLEDHLIVIRTPYIILHTTMSSMKRYLSKGHWKQKGRKLVQNADKRRCLRTTKIRKTSLKEMKVTGRMSLTISLTTNKAIFQKWP